MVRDQSKDLGKESHGRCKTLGRGGPNLIVYRTRSAEERNHRLIPFDVTAPMLSFESLKLRKNETYRLNLTLANDWLHVSHREGYVSVEDGLATRILVEVEAAGVTCAIEHERISLRTRSYEAVVEGIARESVVLSRSRSSVLRREALRLSGGVCACCGIDFSKVLNGRALRALQVHHKKQLALLDTPEATSLEDLAAVCANCHAIIHTDQKNSMEIDALKDAWSLHHRLKA